MSRDGSLFADADAFERARRARALSGASYPFVDHRPGARARRRDGGRGGKDAVRERERSSREGSVARASERGAYVRVEDVLASTTAAEEALREAARGTRTVRAEERKDESERERVKRYARAQLEAEERGRALEEATAACEALREENERLARELREVEARRAANAGARGEDDEDVDETVQELFDLVESERRARREAEERLKALERANSRAKDVEAVAQDTDAQRRIEEAESLVRDQEVKLSQAAEIIGELRSALMQAIEAVPPESTTNSQRGDEPTEGTPLERTTAAVKQWEGKVERMVMETVTSALERVMQSPALNTNKREGERVVASVTDAITHELSSIIENAMSGIVDEMKFQFGREEGEYAHEEFGIGGRKRFIVWLADENSRRVRLEEQLTNVQDELARSEASRQIATQRWLQAMSQMDGSVMDDESELGELLSRLDDASDDGISVHSLDAGDFSSPLRRRVATNRRAMSVAGDPPRRASRVRGDDTKSETYEHANLGDVSLGTGARLRTFHEEDDDFKVEEKIADLAIEATPGGSVYFAFRAVMRRVLLPFATHVSVIVYRIAVTIHSFCARCAANPNFELIWPIVVLFAAFYWKIGAFDNLTFRLLESAATSSATSRAVYTAPPPAPPAPISGPPRVSIRIVD